jgi:hypothetical protein
MVAPNACRPAVTVSMTDGADLLTAPFAVKPTVTVEPD